MVAYMKQFLFNIKPCVNMYFNVPPIILFVDFFIHFAYILYKQIEITGTVITHVFMCLILVHSCFVELT